VTAATISPDTAAPVPPRWASWFFCR